MGGEKGFSALTWVNVILKRYQFLSAGSGHSSSILDTFVVSVATGNRGRQLATLPSCATVERKVRSGSNDVDLLQLQAGGLLGEGGTAIGDPLGYSANAGHLRPSRLEAQGAAAGDGSGSGQPTSEQL